MRIKVITDKSHHPSISSLGLIHFKAITGIFEAQKNVPSIICSESSTLNKNFNRIIKTINESIFKLRSRKLLKKDLNVEFKVLCALNLICT